MATDLVFHAVTQTYGGGADATNINAAFDQAGALGQDPAIVGRWLGTRARIVRTGGLAASISLSPGNTTHATRVWSVPDGRPTEAVQAVATLVQQRLQQALAADTSDDWTLDPPAVLAPAVNGDHSWWASDQAAVTRTENGPEVLNNASPEYPEGPTTPANTAAPPSTVGSLLPWWLWPLGGAIVVVALAPSINAAVQAASVRRRLSATR